VSHVPSERRREEAEGKKEGRKEGSGLEMGDERPETRRDDWLKARARKPAE